MRVLHVAKVTGIAGAENHLLVLLPALRALGVDAEVVLLQEPGRPVAQLVRAFLAAGVPTFELAINMDLDPWLVGRLARLVRSRGARAVHTHGVHADCTAGCACRDWMACCYCRRATMMTASGACG